MQEITKRDKSKPGTSLIEKSLLCDKNSMRCGFRIVSKREINTNLEPLTLLFSERIGNDDFIQLQKILSNKYKNIKSPNGRTLGFWVNAAVWECEGSMQDLEIKNMRNMSKIM
jgi:hypothetical protein